MKTLAIKNNDCLCWKCLQTKSNIHTIEIHEMGWGSFFNGVESMLQLCEECYQESNPQIWSLETMFSDAPHSKKYNILKYKHDQEMKDYIENLPLESQQRVLNEFDNGWSSDGLDPEEWLSYAH